MGEKKRSLSRPAAGNREYSTVFIYIQYKQMSTVLFASLSFRRKFVAFSIDVKKELNRF